MMGSRSETLRVGEVHVLGNQETCLALRSLPDDWIGLACDSLFHNGVDIVAHRSQPWGQQRGQILIEFDLHRIWGMAGTGRSSSADAAAKAITARMSSGVRLGKSFRISSTESP